MKKILFLVLFTVSYQLVSASEITKEKDTSKVNQQIRKLDKKVVDLQTELVEIQKRLPERLAAVEETAFDPSSWLVAFVASSSFAAAS
ncbi:MAG: hypothetical protein EOO88_49555 [Pedobacter sp.]|nr:MAG: hypothetical protein EOO88_49555 [Pedobacter sp.]